MADDLASQLPEIREAPGGLPDPGHRAARLRGRRRHRLAREEGANPGLRRRHRDRRQGHAAARLGRQRPRLPHRQGSLPGRGRRDGVLRRAARPGGRRPRPHGRQRATTSPACRGVGAGHGEEVDRASTGASTALLEHADEIKGKVGESLRAHREDALLSRRLVEIPVDLPMPFDPDALRRSEPDFGGSKELFVRLEFHSLAAEIHGDAARGARARPPNGSPPGRPVSGDRRPGRRRPADARATTRCSPIGDGEKTFDRRRGPGGHRGAAGRRSRRTGAAVRDGRRQAARRAARRRTARRSGRPLRRLPGAVRPVARASRARSSSRMAFQRLGQRLLPDKEAGIVRLRAARGLRDRQRRPLAGRARLRSRRARRRCFRPSSRRGRRSRKLYREIERPLTPVLARMELAGVAIDAPLLGEMSATHGEASCAPSSRGSGRRPARSSTSTPPSSSDRSSSRS